MHHRESGRSPHEAGPAVWALLLLCLASAAPGATAHQEYEGQEWTRDFAVELKGDKTEADLIVSTHGFRLVRAIPELNVYHVHHPDACSKQHRCRRHAEDLVQLLRKEPHVTRVEQQFVLQRDKRRPSEKAVAKELARVRALMEAEESREEDEEHEKDLIYKRQVIERHEELKFDYNDPLYRRQFHLDNYGQIANAGLDLNLLPAWRKGYFGQGSRVTVVDDGVDTQHPDLRHAYDPLISADLNDPTDLHGNPRGPARIQPHRDSHGTECAGEIAAQSNNSVCGSGVAPRVKLGGVRILAGKITDLLEAYSILHQHNETQVYSCSWGPRDNGKTMEMPHHYTGKALAISATRGRKGLGNIFTFASGNGGLRGDNCGPDGYVNSPYSFPMAAVNIYGRSVFYGERCAGIIAAVPVGGRSAADAGPGGPESGASIVTTAINGKCALSFKGTSAAAPLGAACMSLVLQANQNLTWRDVQHVVSVSTRIPNDVERVWQRNGAGIHVSHHFGFGLLDCSLAVKNAQNWVNVPPRESCHYKIFEGKDRLYANRSRRYPLTLTNCSVVSIEHVTVQMRIDHVLRGDLEVWLVSPAGTASRLLGMRWPDRSSKGVTFTFLTRFLMGESPLGRWTLLVRDLGLRRTKSAIRGAVRLALLTVYGTAERPAHLKGRRLAKARRLSAKQVRDTYRRERQRALSLFPQHRDVINIKRLLRSGQKVDAKQLRLRTKALIDNPAVSEEELRGVAEALRAAAQ